MAAYAASMSSWIPEDDILLKNAVEAGASLEALAKGAVRFSRKFSVAELEHRWHSLLYDPVIAAEAAALMAEFELSSANNQAKTFSFSDGDHSGGPQKRTPENVQRLYYTMRKRTWIQSLNCSNLGFLASPNMSDGLTFQEHVSFHYETPVESSMVGDCAQSCLELQEMDIDYMHRTPQDNNFIKDSLGHSNYVHEDSAHILGETLIGFENCPVVERMGPSDALLENDAPFYVSGYSSLRSRTPLWKTMEFIPTPEISINMSHEGQGQGSVETFILPDDMNEKTIVLSTNPEFDLVDLSESLLNFGNDKELHFIDADKKNLIDKCCHDNINLIVLSSPNDIHRDDVPDVKEPHTYLAMPDETNLAEVEVIAEQIGISHGNHHNIFCSEVSVPSSMSIPNPPSHELLDEEIFCTLNSEDTEIPCNDDFIPRKVVASVAPQTSYNGASELTSSFDACNEQKLQRMKKNESSTQYFAAFSTRVSDMFPGSKHSPQFCGIGVRSKSTDVYSLNSISRRANAHGDFVQYRSAVPAQTSLTHLRLKEKLLHTSSASDKLLHAKSSSTTHKIPKPEARPLDSEAMLEEEEYESDDYLSDISGIESTILDWDLCPEDLDTPFSKEGGSSRVPAVTIEQQEGRKLQYKSSKEQDASNLGYANKISRRQALIEMEENGSFIMGNIVRSLIFLYGKKLLLARVSV